MSFRIIAAFVIFLFGMRVNGQTVMPAENGAYPPNQNGLIHPQLSLKWA